MVTVHPKVRRVGGGIDEEGDDLGRGGTTMTDACYCPSSSSIFSVVFVALVGISIVSNLGVVRTVKSPCDLVEILARDVEEGVSYPGEEVQGGGGGG